MAPPLEISIPSTILSNTTSEKPYTLYNISLRLPLRTFVMQKRYSDFAALHSTLTSLIPDPPPAPLPSKSWFKSTASSPELTEERRAGLEQYLRAIAENPDRRWRETSAWRTFLNLPSSSGSASSARGELIAAHQRGLAGSAAGQVAADPQVWLDLHREMKSQLHDARLFLGRRDGATTTQAQYEAGASAKKSLVKAGGLLGNLEEGLKILTESGKRGQEALGAGEIRRRRDLLGSAKVERDGLEKLAVNLAVKTQNAGDNGNGSKGSTQQQDKNALFGSAMSRPSGRVLGGPAPETEQTQALDNEGVLQLQKQIMEDQDQSVEQLAKMVRRQKEIGLAIRTEVEEQNEMLNMMEEDVGRVQKKLNISNKRAGNIS